MLVRKLWPLLALGLAACSLETKPSEPEANAGSTDPVDAWLVKSAVRVLSTDHDVAGNELDPLEAALGSAHIIGVGEATHGTREFFEMKHRLLRDFVSRIGVTAFAIEA